MKKRDKSSETNPAAKTHLPNISSGRWVSRRQAKTRFGKKKGNPRSQTKADTLRILNEMTAHQIELEMQNEELVQARAEVERAYSQYTDLYDFAPVGYFTLGRDGAILEVNLAGANLLGAERGKLIRRQLALFVSEESHTVMRAFLEKLSTCEGKESCELAFEKKGNGLHWARLEATCFEGGQESRIVMVDITERKQAEQALQESESRYRELIELAVDGILIGSHAGIIIDANSHMLKLAGRTLDDLVGKPIQALFNSSELIRTPFRFDLLQQGETVTNVRNLVRPDGKVIPVEMHTKMMPNGTYQSIYRDITERLQAQNALQTSEANLKAIFENSPQSFMVIDRNRTIQSFNWITGKNAKAIFGVEIQVGDPVYKIIRSGEWEIFERNFEHALSGEKVRVEKMFEVGASILWFEFQYAPVITNNEINSVFFSTLNITERKRAEEALKQSEAQYRLLVENQTDLVVKVDNTGSFLYISPSYCRVFGKTESELIGKSFIPLVHEEDVESTQNEMKKLYQFPYTCQVEQRAMTKDGWRWFGWSDTAELNNDNEVVSIIGVGRDITERKQMERALRESEDRYRTVVSNMPVVTFVTDEKGIFILSEGKGLAKLGLQPNQVVGLSLFDVYHDYPSIIAAMKNALAGHTQRDEVEVMGIVFDVVYSPILDQQGKVTKVIGVSNDVTERKQAELELQAALDRVQQLAHTDVLTGINNRRHLYEVAEREFKIAVRYQQPLSVIMFDIDHFKKVNDTFGHTAGDQILQLVTRVCRKELRSADVIGRYGGEEFVILLPITNAQQAYQLAERIRMGTEAICLPTEKGNASVTLSLGIVELIHDAQTQSVEELIHRADEAMYAAKQAGRNRSEIDYQ